MESEKLLLDETLLTEALGMGVQCGDEAVAAEEKVAMCI